MTNQRRGKTRTSVLAKAWRGFTGMNPSTPRCGPATLANFSEKVESSGTTFLKYTP